MSNASNTKNPFSSLSYMAADSSHRQSKSRIELTHIQNQQYANDRPQMVTSITQNPPNRNTSFGQSTKKEDSIRFQFSGGNPQFNNRLYALMKEQIDIAAFNFSQKIGQTLRAQTKEIHRLSAIISNNNKVIQRQQEIINNLYNNEDYMTSTMRSRQQSRDDLRATSKSAKKINLTQNKSLKKVVTAQQVSPYKNDSAQMNVLNQKINTLRASINDIEDKIWDGNRKTREIIARFHEIESKLGGQMWKKIQNCQKIVNKYLQASDSKNPQKTLDVRELSSRIQSLKQQVQEVKELMLNLANREFNYDSYQLQSLKKDFARINQKVRQISNQSHQPRLSDQKMPKDSLKSNRTSHVSHTHSMVEMDDSFLDNFQKPHNLSMRGRPSQITEVNDSSQKSEDWELVDNNEGHSDDEQFYFQEPGAQKNKEFMLEDLERILKRNRFKFPVKVQVDQTGYLKEQTTGMYILDEYDNGFELSNADIQILKAKGVITI